MNKIILILLISTNCYATSKECDSALYHYRKCLFSSIHDYPLEPSEVRRIKKTCNKKLDIEFNKYSCNKTND